MTDELRITMTSAFKGLKQKILWKWESEEMKDKPSNIKLSKWLPQESILAHPNLKLFVTHGGQSSCQEALCHKKPTVVVPIFGDQPSNAIEAERRGYGINIPFPELTTEKLSNGINRILQEPKFTQRAIGKVHDEHYYIKSDPKMPRILISFISYRTWIFGYG